MTTPLQAAALICAVVVIVVAAWLIEDWLRKHK